MAAFLAWLFPGAGHLYQGRIAKGLLLMIVIWSTFFFGFYLGAGRVVYLARVEGGGGRGVRAIMARLPYLCQVWAGLPALPAVVEAYRTAHGGEPWFGDRRWYVPPEVDPNNKPDELDLLHKHLHRYFELGTVYTIIAGLLNVLAIYDAWGGPAYYGTSRKPDDEPPPTEPAPA